MNRIEFMEELSGLLQDIPEEDRMDALNYYNDYFFTKCVPLRSLCQKEFPMMRL